MFRNFRVSSKGQPTSHGQLRLKILFVSKNKPMCIVSTRNTTKQHTVCCKLYRITFKKDDEERWSKRVTVNVRDKFMKTKCAASSVEISWYTQRRCNVPCPLGSVCLRQRLPDKWYEKIERQTAAPRRLHHCHYNTNVFVTQWSAVIYSLSLRLDVTCKTRIKQKASAMCVLCVKRQWLCNILFFQ